MIWITLNRVYSHTELTWTMTISAVMKGLGRNVSPFNTLSGSNYMHRLSFRFSSLVLLIYIKQKGQAGLIIEI